MTRFYFDLRHDDEPWSPDEEGVDLLGRAEARLEALDLLGALAKDQARDRRLIAVRVRDHGPEPFLEVTLSIAVQPPD